MNGAETVNERRATRRARGRVLRRVASVLVAAGVVAGGMALGTAATAVAAPAPAPSMCPGMNFPELGPDVCVFSPSVPQATIQTDLDAIAAVMVPDQFGSQRIALLFEPGTYGSTTHPLVFQVGYYTEVAGLGLNPGDVVINGEINVSNQCAGPGNCTGLDNFWRSLSNLTINVTVPASAPCDETTEFWAASQASPIRRVAFKGNLFLFDYCSSPAYVSGGYIADSEMSGGVVVNGGQQQYLVRNSSIDLWTNGVWNQVFAGDVGAPATSFGPGTSQYTTLATSPVTREEPYLYQDGSGHLRVFVPSVQRDTSGPSWAGGPTPGTSLPLSRFFLAGPGTRVGAIDAALARGMDLILTPGVYDLAQPIVAPHSNTIVMGMGFATLVPQHGQAAMLALGNAGVEISGLIFDAGPVTSPVLLSVGTPAPDRASASDPDAIQDVFFRIGGAETTPVSATVSLLDNASGSIIDDVWAWRADHGNVVGWTLNRAATGVVVTGDGVTAYGLFVEHYQKDEVVWSGQGGTDIFFQNEMPYDPPSQAAWMQAPGVDGYPAFLVTPDVRSFTGYGMGSYSFFDQGVSIYSANAFEVPATLPPESLRDLFTIFLNPATGRGGILNVVDGTGGPSTAANADTPVDVASFPS